MPLIFIHGSFFSLDFKSMKFFRSVDSWSFSTKVSRNKAFEFEWLSVYDWMPVIFSLRWTRRMDHPGIYIHVSFLTAFKISFHDIRHWNSEKGAFEELDIADR